MRALKCTLWPKEKYLFPAMGLPLIEAKLCKMRSFGTSLSLSAAAAFPGAAGG